MPKQAKCINCGYLAVRDEYVDGACEATEITRERGLHRSSTGSLKLAKLFCYKANSCFLTLEGRDPEPRPLFRPKSPEVAVTALNTPIECEDFFKWIPGKSPTEHEDMIWQQRALEAQSQLAEVQGRMAAIHESFAQWREEQANKDRKFDQQLEALEELRHQETRNDSAKQGTLSFWFNVLMAAIAAVSAIAACIAAYKE